MNKTPTISIIVPIYNTEKYLQRCLDSIVAQTYKYFECILVDDGSTDSSSKICDEYAAKDNRFRVLHKENGGVSSARNLGLEKATGEWIFFMDADDELIKNCLMSLISPSQNVQMVIGVMRCIYTSESPHKKQSLNYKKDVLSPQSYLHLIINGRYGNLMTVFPKLYKRSIIINDNLKFDENIFYAEDQLFLARYICSSSVKQLYFNNTEFIYKYFIRDNSTMGKFENSYEPKFITDLIAFSKIQEVYENKFRNDNEIILWARKCTYSSGRHLQILMSINKVDNAKQKEYINGQINRITNNGQIKAFEKDYQRTNQFRNMKRIASKFPREERASLINKWLHSKDCYFLCMNWKWKLVYIMAHLFGVRGIKPFMSKMNFDI